MVALVLGTVLAIATLAFVLYPLFFGVPRRRAAIVVADEAVDRESAVLALREIEFDRATGKLSDTDYGDLKARYTAQAITAMRRESATSAGAPNDEIEAAVLAYRAAHPGCPVCGPRPEDDAVYCSNCGRYLHDRCAGCGAPVDAPDARYCVSCGDRLAA
ncbi:MAG TPA: zinc ribbon domain-containing protein [Gemmatimonadaceae bacterium]|jgi:hypothetical protein|nr:zinc ribbon domain-containing protein [Gemmatimonadaceae bacterium]